MIYDVDGDGWPDIVFGGDWQSKEVWWWHNPGRGWKPDVPWKRYTIKKTGETQHHDQIIGDFKGTGKPQLVYWNQGAKKLFIADIPPHPTEVEEWPATEVFEGTAGENPGKYAEGVAAIDMDDDGRVDLLAGNYWFKYLGNNKFKPIKIGDIGGRIAAGHLLKGSKIPQVVIAPGDGVGPLKWYECKGDPTDSQSWVGHDLLGRDMIHGHSLQIADIDGDGKLDIPHGYEFQPAAEGTLFDRMAQQTQSRFVHFEMDVFWIVHPGQDPVALMRKYPTRFPLMHLND